MGLTGVKAAVGGLRVQGVWVHELVPRYVQNGTLLVPELSGVSPKRGVRVPVMGPAWIGDRGVRVERGVVWSPEVRVPFVAEMVTEVRAGEVVVGVRHL